MPDTYGPVGRFTQPRVGSQDHPLSLRLATTDCVTDEQMIRFENDLAASMGTREDFVRFVSERSCLEVSLSREFCSNTDSIPQTGHCYWIVLAISRMLSRGQRERKVYDMDKSKPDRETIANELAVILDTYTYARKKEGFKELPGPAQNLKTTVESIRRGTNRLGAKYYGSPAILELSPSVLLPNMAIIDFQLALVEGEVDCALLMGLSTAKVNESHLYWSFSGLMEALARVGSTGLVVISDTSVVGNHYFLPGMADEEPAVLVTSADLLKWLGECVTHLYHYLRYLLAVSWGRLA